jgi:hypothetical protein
MAFGIVMTLYGRQNLVELISIQNGILLTTLPVYLFGLYGKRFDPHPRCHLWRHIRGHLAISRTTFVAEAQSFVF